MTNLLGRRARITSSTDGTLEGEIVAMGTGSHGYPTFLLLLENGSLLASGYSYLTILPRDYQGPLR